MGVRPLDNWNAETSFNYILQYVLRWIPFNTWYIKNSGHEKDRDALNSYKSVPDNGIYNRINYLIHDKNDFDAVSFRHYLVALDELLELHVINELRFQYVDMGQNTQNDVQHISDGWSLRITRYKEATDGHPKNQVEMVMENLADRTQKYVVRIKKHDAQMLHDSVSFSQLPKKRQRMIDQHFQEVSPNIIVDIKKCKTNKIKIGNHKYLNDDKALSAAIIDLLYEMRCKAAHGEVDINENVRKAYNYAYNMLDIITKTLY